MEQNQPKPTPSMVTKKWYERDAGKPFLILLGIFILIVIVKANTTPETKTSSSSSSTKSIVNSAQVVVKPTEKPVVLTIQDKLWKAVDESIHTRRDVTVEFDTGTAMMTFYKDTYLNENHLVKDAYTAFVNFGTEAFKIPEVQEVNVQSKVDLTDKYGKKTRDTVVAVTMNRETFMKFDWANLRNVKSANIYQTMKENAQLHSISLPIMKNLDTSNLWIK